MNEKTVGTENLPNVYIEKINIYPAADSRKRIVIRLSMFDHSPDRSWYNKIDDLQVKLAFVAGDEISRIENSLISLYSYSAALEGVFVSSANQFEIFEEMDFFTKFIFDVEYILDPVENLNVYVASFIENLEFGNPLFDKFYGPMSGEKIYVGGFVNKTSGYFYYPDTDEEYAGPVHQKDDGSYMEGSVHSEEPHKVVRYVQEDNFKITEVTPLDDPGYADPDEGETTLEGEVIG